MKAAEIILSLMEADRKYSCLMAVIPRDVAARILRWNKVLIPEDVLDPEEGRESEPHVTVKFGLHEAKPSDKLKKLIANTQPFKIKLGKTSIFENEKYDVVKLSVESKAIHAFNAAVKKAVQTTDTYPTYIPHLTLAYVKPGEGKRFVGKSATFPEIEITQVKFSGPSDRDPRCFEYFKLGETPDS